MVGGENEFEKDAVLFSSFYDLLGLHGIDYCGFPRDLIDDASTPTTQKHIGNKSSGYQRSIIVRSKLGAPTSTEI